MRPRARRPNRERTGQSDAVHPSTPQESGWQWRIPLQHRIGNGHVFSSAFTSEERAAELLLATVDTKPLAEPRLLKFKAGQRKSPWVKNVVSAGLAAGFLEPLESTSIHLVQSAIKRMVTYFPTRDFNPLTIEEYNRATSTEWEGIRDFIILHCCAPQRTDIDFWKYRSAMKVPESLQRVIDHFRIAGRFTSPATNLFTKSSWFAVFMGQFVEPKGYHPLVDSRPGVDAAAHFAAIANWVDRTVDNMPEHGEFIARNCKASMAA